MKHHNCCYYKCDRPGAFSLVRTATRIPRGFVPTTATNGMATVLAFLRRAFRAK